MSKTTKNSHGTAKKLYTGTVISALATGLVGTIGTAHADTTETHIPTTAKNEPALVEKEAPKKTEVKTPTKEEVAELGASANTAQDDADIAKEVLDQANEKSDKAEKKVDGLKQDVADAQKIADKATPEVLQNAEKKVEKPIFQLLNKRYLLRKKHKMMQTIMLLFKVKQSVQNKQK